MSDPKPRKKRLSMTDKAVIAMYEAVGDAIREHRLRNVPLSIWENGRIIELPPDQAVIPQVPEALRHGIRKQGKSRHS